MEENPPYITDLNNIARCTPETTVGSALALIKSSHEPVFVFDKNNKFLGLVSPYYSLFKKRYPYTTKVKSLIINPPGIGSLTPFYELAEFMVSTRIYTLPVFDKDKLKGTITARNIIENLIKKPGVLGQIAQKIQMEKPLTIKKDATIKDTYKLLRRKGTTRVIVVNEKGKLLGIIARKDIESALTKPTQRQRFSTKIGKNMINYPPDQETPTRFNRSISNFFIRNVLTAQKELDMKKIIRKMVDSGMNSIVIVDKNNYPFGIISNRTILKVIAQLRPKRKILIILRKPIKRANNYEIDKIYALLEKFGEKMDKISLVQQIRINFKKSKKPSGGIILFDITLQIDFLSGKHFIAEVKDRRIEMGIRKAIKKIEKQERRRTEY